MFHVPLEVLNTRIVYFGDGRYRVTGGVGTIDSAPFLKFILHKDLTDS